MNIWPVTAVVSGQSRLGGTKKGKSYCENTKKPATSFPSYDPNIHIRSTPAGQ